MVHEKITYKEGVRKKTEWQHRGIEKKSREWNHMSWKNAKQAWFENGEAQRAIKEKRKSNQNWKNWHREENRKNKLTQIQAGKKESEAKF